MDLISKAIADIKSSIPRAMLKLAYKDRYAYQQKHIDLDEQIRLKTIYARVIPDANIIGGETIYVDLQGLTPQMVDLHNYYYEIPANRLNNRMIISPLSVNYMAYSSAVNTLSPGLAYDSSLMANDISSMAARSMDSNASLPTVSNPEVQLAGHNVVLIRNHIMTAAATYLKCVVANDADMQNFDLRTAPQFSKLCILAAKAYIYNELFDDLERGRIEGGHEIGVVKSYWESLSDAEQNYLDYRDNVWAEVSTMNDRLLYEDFLRMQIDPSL